MSKENKKQDVEKQDAVAKVQHEMDSISKDAQADQLKRFGLRKKSTPPPPRFTIKDGAAKLASGNLIALMETCGTTDSTFAQEFAHDLSGAICHTENDKEQHTFNAGFAAIAGIAPIDEAEAMLAAQMVAVHKAGMKMIGQTMRADSLEVAQWRGNFAVKLFRTYAQQMEALQRYRGKGEQKMTVEHVHVHAGGQAIVGNVTPTGGVGLEQKREEQPHAKQITYAPVSAMPCTDTAEDCMPITRDDKRTLPNARRKIYRRTKGQ